MFDQGKHVVLRRDGVEIVLKVPEGEMPQIVRWGKDLKVEYSAADFEALDAMTLKITPPNKPDAAWRPSLIPQGVEGWSGRPGIELSRGDAPVFVRWDEVSIQTEKLPYAVEIVARDNRRGAEVGIVLGIEEGGLVTIKQTVRNTAEGGNANAEPLSVHWLDASMPVSKSVDTLTHFTGRWPLEKQPQSMDLPVGSITRDCRKGKTGHESPWMFILSEGAPQSQSGTVWACHLAWSGNQTYRCDNLPAHEPVFGAGELLGPGEIRLLSGESYEAPTVCFAWSDQGLDGISERFYMWLRSMPQRARTPRPLTLNTWEAVYFDHDEDTLKRLADRAAFVGVERFVLDDGWFLARRDDTKGLGDWIVDRSVWKNGLEPLADHVHGLGMQFGLWFEPEMISLDSDLARAHRDWILADADAVPYREDLSYRNQYVLDLANPQAYAYIRSHMAQLIEELHIDYIKWDHNREVTEPVHNGKYGLHAQTLACYALFDDLKSQFPGLEIESCASGGARTDAGILAHADRVWGSDSNDPRNRIDIQRWTEMIVPPEMIGAHIGPSPAHTTARATDLSYRAAVSLMGCAGLEWNILECSDAELEAVAEFVRTYKQYRALLHSGRVMHADFVEKSLRARGVVSSDGLRALWTVASVDDVSNAFQENLHIPSLDEKRRYRVKVVRSIGETQWGWVTPQWLSQALTDEGFETSGLLLSQVGVLLPPLWPMQAFMLDIQAMH
ncbi:alpha-galactosidase [Alloscardovia criceti]|uniref:alpha-galactosidase n=1 Tax=Alloscardovia criceti TaxID=356828 RepID=UPI0003677B58|nr:alpha-galactosidase [Alloscardovia criceti]